MRVVAGSAGGLVLKSPRTDIRPTMDRVKAAIFSSLGERVLGAQVLDLFAGTGSLGIEALSRGAASATFVENDAKAVESIRLNLVKTQLTGAVQHTDVFSFLDRTNDSRSFNIVFADPPYAKNLGERDFTPELLASAALARVLAPEGIFVLEKLPGAPLPAGFGWEVLRMKKYGATEVAFLKRAGE